MSGDSTPRQESEDASFEQPADRLTQQYSELITLWDQWYWSALARRDWIGAREANHYLFVFRYLARQVGQSMSSYGTPPSLQHILQIAAPTPTVIRHGDEPGVLKRIVMEVERLAEEGLFSIEVRQGDSFRLAKGPLA